VTNCCWLPSRRAGRCSGCSGDRTRLVRAVAARPQPGLARPVLLFVTALTVLTTNDSGALTAGRHMVTAPGVVVGVAAQLSCGAVGIAIGLLCSRQMIPRAGYALLLAIILDGLLVIGGGRTSGRTRKR
jgi:RNA 3'-terminal phosphate cyclase